MATFDGQRAVGIEVFRVGDQTPIGVSDAARRAMERIEAQLPPGINWSIRRDMAETYRQRLDLLLKNAVYGLILVLLTLGLFLEFKLALWVTMAVCRFRFWSVRVFAGQMDVTINMISIVRVIIALGMVVDMRYCR